MSEECAGRCYNVWNSSFKETQTREWTNRKLSESVWFVPWMILELRRLDVRVLRVHADGDYPDLIYTRKWFEITQASPLTCFYTYTRSWVVPEIRRELARIARLPNASVWFSTDRSMRRPGRLPRNVREAYLQVAPEDVPEGKAPGLVFRDRHLRKTPIKRVAGALVCPVENGITYQSKHWMTCERCKFCFREQYEHVLKKREREDGKLTPDERGRIPLPLVA
jgi:hypothetical protein